jgi:hypothetical protein
MESQAVNGYSPARHGQWLALAEALDAAVVTLHTAIPDPLWFGPARNAFDHHVEHVMTELRLARGAVLDAEAGLP